ncbi:hypothetical protein QFC19_004073 [Naganishia cerealis]|uniref:Uncharacterized protein n=1 Tax=Naganishia cerealis TaxID=610337 RepID=A0ACC2VYN0_9TREE|nr:hypothetical protein QFC19_004073 [Naganishia cerealis]
MGFRSPELHVSALSPSEYAIYTPIVARLLETHIGFKDSDLVTRKNFQILLKEEWGVAENQLQEVSQLLPIDTLDSTHLQCGLLLQIFARLPSYPSSQLPVGEIYATLRILAHQQQATKVSAKTNLLSGASQDELVFIQCKPLSIPTDKHPLHTKSLPGRAEVGDTRKEQIISAEPLLPPPRRQTSLKVESFLKPSVQPHSTAIRALDNTDSATPLDTRTLASTGGNKRSMHIKSKSTGTSTTLPRSTPLLNPFRTAHPSGQPGFVSPPPIPPKPSAKIVARKPVDVQETTLLIAIEDGATGSIIDSNPFRRRQSVPRLSASEQKPKTEQMNVAKPPLPPRVVPDTGTANPSTSTSGDRARKQDPRPSIQPTSLLQPSRLIREGLMAAEQARTENYLPGNRLPVSNPQFVTQTQQSTWSGSRRSNTGDTDDESSNSSTNKRVASRTKSNTKDRSNSLLSDTTEGVATSNSSMEGLRLDGKFRQSSIPSYTVPNHFNSRPSPFDDSNVPWPTPPKRNAPSIDGSARLPNSFDIITRSSDTDGITGGYGQGQGLSRRSTLKASGSDCGTSNTRSTSRGTLAPPIDTENLLTVMTDLGEDVRRAADGVGKDLEWLRGGRGGRTFVMTVPAHDDHGGDGRRGLMQGIGKNDTGSTAASSEF